MKTISAHNLLRYILTPLSAIFFHSFVCATDTVEFEGITYELSDNTFLLDKEGIYGSPRSFTEASELFCRVNQVKGNAVVLVAPSVYWVDDPEDATVRTDKGGTPFAIHLNCDSLSIIGLSNNPEDIVFAVNRGQTQGAVGNFTMFNFSGQSLDIKNITFGNYCNVDLIYPRNPDFNRKKRKDAIVQAQIGICDGTDRLYAENCRFISRLNLCPFVGARRSLYDNCYFECTDDALSGSAIYLDCRFTFFSSKPFYSTAETGAVFLNCDITCLGSGVQHFTKIPGQVTAIDTKFNSEKPIEIKWTRDPSDIVCYQENITLNGKPYIIDSDRPELGHILSGTALRNAFKFEHQGKSFYNIPNLLNGDDRWDPIGMNAEVAKTESETGMKLTGLPVSLRIKTEKPKFLFNGDEARILYTPILWGGYPAGDTQVITYMAENDTPAEKHIVIPILTQDGLHGHQSLTIEPNLRKSPKFKRKPKVIYDESEGKLRVDYSLTGKGEDISGISWTRVYIGDSIKYVSLSDADAPKGRFYTPKAGDLGYGIVAIVFPQYKDSHCGLPDASQVFEITDPRMVEEIPESHLSTDFSDVPIWKWQPGIPGIWNFDVFKPDDTSHVDWQVADGTGWYYGKGFDASTGVGLVQNEKGARMSYVPARDVCQDMTVSLIAEPAKSGGQGFGSATTQYMDICVKFDPINLNGYALRIERTPDHDRAVRFSLIKYDNGHTSVISDEVISDCFRTPCHINVGITNGMLHASAYTEAPQAERKCCEDVVDKVEINVPVESGFSTGFCIQHTGSTGPSSTLLRDLEINWK